MFECLLRCIDCSLMFIKSLLSSGPSVKDFTWQNSLKQVLLASHTTDHKTEFAGEPVQLTM